MTQGILPFPYPLIPVAKSATYTANPGELVEATGGITITLPTPRAGTAVGVVSINGTTAAPCTVTTPSGVIVGPGASAASILLRARAAYVILLADGTNWRVIGGASAAPGTEVAYAEITTAVTVSGTSGAQTTVVTAPAFTASGVDDYWVEFFSPWVIDASGDLVQIELWDGATSLGRLALIGSLGTTGGVPVLARRKVPAPTAGAHTYTIKAYRITSNGTISADNGVGGNVVPAYVSVTVA